MGLYNFKPQFVPYIEDWSKRHTIRGERQHPDHYGNAMHLYTGLRHPGARCLMRPRCLRTDFVLFTAHFQIRIGASVGFENFDAPYGDGARCGGFNDLSEDESNTLAWRDGFRPAGSTLTNPGDAIRLMAKFWEGKFPWQGTIYHWDPSSQLVKRLGLWTWEKVAAPKGGLS